MLRLKTIGEVRTTGARKTGNRAVTGVLAVGLLVAGDDGVNERNADAAAYIAQEIVKAAGVADLLVGEGAHRGGGERDEDEAAGDTAENDWPE